jgi:hypothetical protein
VGNCAGGVGEEFYCVNWGARGGDGRELGGRWVWDARHAGDDM